MRTGAIFARGSCRALKWMALFGVVFALGAGQAAAQATYKLTVAEKPGSKVTLSEGQSLVPVSVTFTIPAESPQQNDRAGTVLVTVSVRQPSDARILRTQGATEIVLQSMQPPVTRAELAGNAGGGGGRDRRLRPPTRT